jgi:hypothetical protein
MARKGICKNYANCDLADSDSIQDIPDIEEFVCGACKKPLKNPEAGSKKEFKGPFKKRPWIAWCAGGALLVALYFIIAAIGNWMRGDPRIGLSATSVVFDFQQIGKGEGIQEIVLKNVGKSGKLDIESVSCSSPDFSARKPSRGIRPGQSARLEIVFKPTTAGQHDATLTLLSDDATRPKMTIQLSGTAGKLGPWWIWDQWEQTSQAFDK